MSVAYWSDSNCDMRWDLQFGESTAKNATVKASQLIDQIQLLNASANVGCALRCLVLSYRALMAPAVSARYGTTSTGVAYDDVGEDALDHGLALANNAFR